MKGIFKYTSVKLVVPLFILFAGWWILIQTSFHPGSVNAQIFGALYGVIALIGGLTGVKYSFKWGGFKSALGRSTLFFSFGLLSQELGQLISSYYNYVLKQNPIPYPSWGDLGFFGTIPLYILGILYLGKVIGAKNSLSSRRKLLFAFLVPIFMLVVSYLVFLRGYQFDWSNPIKVFLDFGYPFGDSLYIALTIVIYFLSRGLLGGTMKNKVLFILIALCVQFLADYSFLYQSYYGSWSVGGINDFLYLLAYFMMTLGLIRLYAQFMILRES